MANLGLSVQSLRVSVISLVYLCKTWLFVLCLGCLGWAWCACAMRGVSVLSLGLLY